MPELFDVIVIGSGPAGAHAALPLVEAGLSVAMIDGGKEAPAILEHNEADSFTNTRRHNPDQYKLFLGENFSGIPVNGLEGGLGGGMTGGNRAYAIDGAATHLPLKVDNGIVIQSLAKGGLGAVWGAACAYLDEGSLNAMGLAHTDMDHWYDEVTKLIGVSGPTRMHAQPAMPPDHHATMMLDAFTRKPEAFDKLKIRVTQPHTAELTQDLNNRTATTLGDMEYYADTGRSVYRPQFTVDELRAHSNFTYLGGNLVEYIEETPGGCVVFGHGIDDPTVRRWMAKRVIVAAGAVNTARILLRSLALYGTPVPFVVKPHIFIPCIHPAALGVAGPDKRSSLCQLLVIDEERDAYGYASACAQLYSYRSLLLFRLLGSVPFLPTPEALGLLSIFAPSLVIADIRFPARAPEEQTLTLTRNEELNIHCMDMDKEGRKPTVQKMRKAMRRLGLVPLHTVNMPEASTSHYAGTVPMEETPSHPLSVNKEGKLHHRKHIYVADAAMFKTLPALPHTLTIMANARRIGAALATQMKQ